MNVTIKEALGETTLEFNIEGGYEEVLALVSELGYLQEEITCDFRNFQINNMIKEKCID